MRFRTLTCTRAIALGCLLAWAAAPSAAHAATATASGTTLTITATVGEALDLTARSVGSSLEVDLGAGTLTGATPAGCVVDFGALVCPSSGVAKLRVIGSGADDHVSLRGATVLDADGGGGDDVLRGGDGADRLVGADGDDDLDGRAGADDLDGGVGSDQLLGADGADALQGGAGDDTIDGGTGADAIDGGEGADSLLGGRDADTITGGEGADQLDGAEDDDQLDGGADADVIFGGVGADRITAGAGNDYVDGAAGADTVDGDSGNDLLFGGAGADDLAGSAGDDAVDGGEDDDTLHGGDGNDQLSGDAGVDIVAGDGGNDRLDGGDGADTLQGGSGDDVARAVGDGDRLALGAGSDTADYSSATAGVRFDAPSGSAKIDGELGNTFTDAPEVVIGTAYADVLVATDVPTAFSAGAGDDRLIGGTAADNLDGGDGRDTVDYSARTASVTIHADGTPVSGSAGEGDRVSDTVEVLIGGAGADDLVGATGPSELFGGPGDDRLEDLLDGDIDLLHCGDGTDLALADRGNDRVDADCERWSDGVQFVRTIDPISVAVRSPRLAVDRSGRMSVSLACGRQAVGTCRGRLGVRILHGGKWRQGPTRSVLLTPGRRRSVTLFAQRGFRALVAPSGRPTKALVRIEARDALGRVASDERTLELTLPRAVRSPR